MSAKLPTARATFKDVSRDEAPFPVHFNPASLQISVSNTLEEKGSGNAKKQYVTKSSTKLTMDLVFDTTDTGGDVREVVGKLARFMEPIGKGEQGKTPPIARFEWGTFAFQGMVEQYRETLDFFSHDGVPLRAGVNLTMASQDAVFSSDQKPPARQVADVLPAAGQSVTDIATQGGNPGAARSVAAANQLESMRFPSGPITVDASIKLSGPVAFASVGGGIGVGLSAGAGASFGADASFGAGGGIGIGGGIGVSGGAGFGASIGGVAGAAGASAGFGAVGGGAAGFAGGFGATAGAGIAGVGVVGVAGIGGAGEGLAAFGASAGAAGVGGGLVAAGGARAIGFSAGTAVAGATLAPGPVFGGAASAGVTASNGAFLGLRTVTPDTSAAPLDTTRLIVRPPSVGVTVDGSSSFRVGGQAALGATGSLSTDVGASPSSRLRIRFEEG